MTLLCSWLCALIPPCVSTVASYMIILQVASCNHDLWRQTFEIIFANNFAVITSFRDQKECFRRQNFVYCVCFLFPQIFLSNWPSNNFKISPNFQLWMGGTFCVNIVCFYNLEIGHFPVVIHYVDNAHLFQVSTKFFIQFDWKCERKWHGGGLLADINTSWQLHGLFVGVLLSKSLLS